MIILTGTQTTEPVVPLELVDGVLSGKTVAGMWFALTVVIAIIAASIIVAYKWRGNAGGYNRIQLFIIDLLLPVFPDRLSA